MAIDPDMQPIIDAMQAEIDALKAGGTGGTDMVLIKAQADFYEALNARIGATNTSDQVTQIFKALTATLGA